MNLLTTLKGSMLENFFPAGWDLAQWDACVADDPKAIFERQPKWHKDYSIRMANNVADFDVMLGHELAMEIRRCREAGRKLALILPVGPMGMYRWTVYFLRDWNIPCDHVCGFNMDEWSDAEGNTLPGNNPGAFQYAMENAFYGPLADLTVPPGQRFFATRNLLPEYPDRIGALRKEGAKLVVVYGIGRACHIAFWEPHFGLGVRERRRMAPADASFGRPPAPPDHRAECHHQFQEPDNTGSGFRQHHRSRILHQRRLRHWRRGWRTGPRHALARAVVVGDAAARREPPCPFHLDAHSAGCSLLYQGARRAFGS